jgi:membrane-associated phospholipid phosphatase
MEKVSKIISWLFLPMLMPIYGLVIAMYVGNVENDGFPDNNLYFGISSELKYRVLVLFIIFTTLFPIMLIMFLKQNGKIKSYEMDDKEDRGFPIFLTSFFCFMLFVLLWYKTKGVLLPYYFYILPLVGGIVIALTGIITRFYKISLHALGSGLFCGFIYMYNLHNLFASHLILWSSFLLAGIIMSARLYLNKHTIGQVMYGFGVGFLAMMLGLKLGSEYF